MLAAGGDLLEGGVDVVGEEGDVAHFSARAGFGFSVEVELGSGRAEQLGPVGRGVGSGPEVAEEVHHDGGLDQCRAAQREPGDDSQELFEL